MKRMMTFCAALLLMQFAVAQQSDPVYMFCYFRNNGKTACTLRTVKMVTSGRPCITTAPC